MGWQWEVEQVDSSQRPNPNGVCLRVDYFNDDLKAYGYITGCKNEAGFWQIGSSRMKPVRKGYGTKLYEKFAEEIRARGGKKLCSDFRLSPDSSGFWAKQEGKGRAKSEAFFASYAQGKPMYCVDLSHDRPIDFSGLKRRRRKRRK